MDMLYELLFNNFDFACLYYEKETKYLKEYKERKEAFQKKLNDDMLKEFKSILNLLESHLLNIRDEECRNTMYTCLKIGMECQEFLDKRLE